MIIVQLNGGLGNQLFQYSSAKALSLQKKVPLLLDMTYFDLTGKRDGLHYFHITDKIATPAELKPFYKRGLLNRAIQRIKPLTKRDSFKERYFRFDPNFLRLGDTVFLKGVRQSERYFADHTKTIRQNLTIKKEYISSLAQFKDDLQNKESVAIHIRRGDYLTKVALDVLGIQEKEYYLAAWSIIASKIQNPTAYFFSDDIQFVEQELLPLIPGKIVSHPQPDNYIDDFYLMSQCKHNIIANSSFSWWAAWLNNNPDKRVIAPKKWFNNGPTDTEDLIPDTWMRI